MGGNLQNSQVSPYLLRLRAAGGEELRVRGKCRGTVWTQGMDGRLLQSSFIFVVVDHANFQVLLGKDWIHSQVRCIDVEGHCLHLRNGQTLPMIQGDVSSRVQRSFAISESIPLRGITRLGFTMLPGLPEVHFLGVERDRNDVEGSHPSMVVTLSRHIQEKVECTVSWTRAGELKLTTVNNSGFPWEVDAGTLVAVEEVSAVNNWHGFAFTLFSPLIIPGGVGRAVTTLLRCSRPIHRNMKLSLQQVGNEGSEGQYQVFHLGAQGQCQEVTVVNQTEKELVLGPETPIMIHVDEWNKPKPGKEAQEDK